MVHVGICIHLILVILMEAAIQMAEPQNDQPPNGFRFKRIELFKNETLGIGSYGVVCKAKCDDLLCAAKILHPILSDRTAEFRIAHHREPPMRRFEQGCKFMNAIRHPNIVQYLGTHRDPDTDLPVLLMELMDDSLTHFLESSQEPIPFHIQVNICHDIAVALSFLHSNDIVHGDMSSNNVLLIGNSRAKVTDFGMAKFDDLNPQTTRASLTICPVTGAYMPPEATTEDTPRYIERIDCFSFGVVSLQILTREFPKPGNRMKEEILHGRQIFVYQSEVDRRQNHISQVDPNHALMPIVLDCLKDEDVERPSAQELCHRVAALKQASQYTDSEKNITQERLIAKIRELQQQLLSKSRDTKHPHLQHQLKISEVDKQRHKKHEYLGQELREKDARLETSEPLVATFQTTIGELQSHRDHPQIQHQEYNSGVESTAIIELSWRESEKAPRKMYEGTDAVVSGSEVYFKYGAIKYIYVYNSTKNIWSQLPNCPVRNYSLAMVNNNLTTIGGGTGHNATNQLFSLTGEGSHKKWTEVLPPMPTKREWVIVISCGVYLIAAGGCIGNESVTTVEVLNIDTMQWSTAADLTLPLAHSSATICGDRIFMLGGWDASKSPTKTVLTCSLSALLQSCHSDSLGGRLKKTLSLTPGATVWSRVADLPLKKSACVTLKGCLLAIGGRGPDHKPTSAVHMYNTTTNSWEVISHMTTPRSHCFAAVLPDNKLMVVGGYIPSSLPAPSDTIEIASII